MSVLHNGLLAVIGVASGLAVGSGFVALLVVLDVIPRLAQLTRSFGRAYWFEGAIVSGALYWTWADFFGWTLGLPHVSVVIVGLLSGVFIGLIAAALTEVLNVFPILAKRLRLQEKLLSLLLAMVIGKIAGSLFDWLIFRDLLDK